MHPDDPLAAAVAKGVNPVAGLGSSSRGWSSANVDSSASVSDPLCMAATVRIGGAWVRVRVRVRVGVRVMVRVRVGVIGSGVGDCVWTRVLRCCKCERQRRIERSELAPHAASVIGKTWFLRLLRLRVRVSVKVRVRARVRVMVAVRVRVKVRV